MSVDITKNHFQGARILSVVENTDQRRLTFEVNYPLTERDADFGRGKLIFECYTRHLVSERDLNGEPTIRSAEVSDVSPKGITIRMKTDYGVREVSCYTVREESPFAGRFTEWRPRCGAWQFGSHGGAAIGELNRSALQMNHGC